MENRNENIRSRRKSRVTGPRGTGATPSGYNPEPGTQHGEGLSSHSRDLDRMGNASTSTEHTYGKEKSGMRSSGRDFSTHYYGNEKDLRERDRIARAGHHPQSYKGSSSHDEVEHDRRSRDSHIGREPYEPEKHYHRASYDRQDFSESSRKNWKQLYNEFYSDFSSLIRKESDLIRTELGEKTSLIKQGAVSITTGTIVAFVGIQAIAATIVIALGYVVSWWLAALITGVGLLLIGIGLMAAAKKKLSGDSLTPHRSMESFDHMGEMFKEKANEITRH